MKKLLIIALVLVLSAGLGASTGLSATIEMVTVGDPGNTADTLTGYGAVAYTYRIGKYEVTNDQYAEFLNTVDPTGANALGLYNGKMSYDPQAQITLTPGNPNGSKYVVATNLGNKPPNWVSFWDAARFCNWLHNGQGLGDTEHGAYEGIGNAATCARQSGAKFFVPNENEWYKGAYYEPGATTSDGNAYWLYPTRSDIAPTLATADSVGNINNPGTNVANYLSGAVWNGGPNVTTVGSAGPASASYYGTFDQGGNLYELMELDNSTLKVQWRGSAYSWGADRMISSYRYPYNPQFEARAQGFRVAAAVAQEGTLHIFKFLDVNGDGVMDQDEMLLDPGMFQFEIFDATGALMGTFPNSQEIPLAAGLYTGQEILFGDWAPTTPNPFEFEIVGGQLTEVFVGNAVPEPATMAMLAAAAAGLVGYLRRRRSAYWVPSITRTHIGLFVLSDSERFRTCCGCQETFARGQEVPGGLGLTGSGHALYNEENCDEEAWNLVGCSVCGYRSPGTGGDARRGRQHHLEREP